MAESKSKLEAALDLMQRMPPKNIEHSLSGLLNLVPDETDELLQRIDQPLQTEEDSVSGRKYLLCDYNRDGDSFRSPWSSQYDPPLEDGLQPSATLRALEILLNEVFALYVQQYYGAQAISSVYCWDLEGGEDGFASCWLVKKDAATSQYIKQGGWDSIHVMDVQKRGASDTFTYRLTSTVMVNLDVDNAKLGSCDLSGSLIRQKEVSASATSNHEHVVNMGKMIEEMENTTRGHLQGIYLSKSNEILCSMHTRGHGQGNMLVGLTSKAAVQRAEAEAHK